MLRQVLLLVLLSISAWAQTARHFTFHYGFTIKDIPQGQKVRVWMPAAHSDDFQEIKIASANGDLRLKKTRESKYGNEIYYAETNKATPSSLHFEVIYDVVRHERIVLGRNIPRLTEFTLKPKDERRDLAPDALIPTTGQVSELAAKVTDGKKTHLDKARSIYDYVLDNMSYDTSGEGWGRGDVLYAVNTKKGDCTDFHSLFIAMARSQGIPTRFETGFGISTDKHSGEIAGYHCWSDFFEPEHGWVPVDISEAWKQQEKRDYYFGANDANRIEFSTGRDLKLNPAQDGEPLNYFVYPYVEVAGKKYENVSLAFSFADAEGNVSETK